MDDTFSSAAIADFVAGRLDQGAARSISIAHACDPRLACKVLSAREALTNVHRRLTAGPRFCLATRAYHRFRSGLHRLLKPISRVRVFLYRVVRMTHKIAWNDVSGEARVLQSSYGRRMMILLGAIPVVAVLIGLLVLNQTTANALLVRHTIQVEQQLISLLSNLQDVERAQRGFLVTGDEAFLAHYKENRRATDATYSELSNLVSDNPQQTAAINALRTQIDDRIAASEMSLDLFRRSPADKSALLPLEMKGKAAMDAVRDSIAKALATEQELYETRSQQYFERKYILQILLVLSLVGGAAGAYALMTQDQKRTRNIMALNTLLEERVAERTAELTRERDRAEVLLRDVTHRVGNALTLVVGFLNLHLRHVKDPESIKTLTSARERVLAIASAQRRINVANDLELVRIDDLIRGVTSDLQEAQSRPDVIIDFDIAAMHASARDATALCVLAQEFVMNAVKHAFPEQRAGRITISIAPSQSGGAVLQVRDNGTATEDAVQRQGGLGKQICERLARQFQGTVTYVVDQGLIVTAVLPGLDLKSVAA